MCARTTEGLQRGGGYGSRGRGEAPVEAAPHRGGRPRLPHDLRHHGAPQRLRRVLQADGGRPGCGPGCHHVAHVRLQPRYRPLHAPRLEVHRPWAPHAQHHGRGRGPDPHLRHRDRTGTTARRDERRRCGARHRLRRCLDARDYPLHWQLVREGPGHGHWHRIRGLWRGIGHRQPHRYRLHPELRLSGCLPWLHRLHAAHHRARGALLPAHARGGGGFGPSVPARA